VKVLRNNLRKLVVFTFLMSPRICGLVYGQRPVEVNQWQYAEPYSNRAQIKILIKGAKGRPISGTKLTLVNEAEVNTFKENGEAELVVQAPECTHNEAQHTVSSAGPLRVRTADGRFFLEGEGFLFQKDDSMLFISNKVHTLLQPDLPAGAATGMPSGAVDPKAITVDSRQLRYDNNLGRGTYSGGVHVSSTNLNMTSEILDVIIPSRERQLKSVTATQDVHIKYSGIEADGQEAVYSTETGLARITGHPKWSWGEREGRGDELLIDRTNQIFRANGEAWVKMPGQAMSPAGFLRSQSLTNQSSGSTSNRFVEITSDYYEFRNNSAEFGDRVQVNETVNGEPGAKMTCRALRATFVGTNELQEMIAEGKGEPVRITKEDQGFSAGNALYSATNRTLRLTDGPSWYAGPRSGKGDTILVGLDRNEMTVSGNASARLPASEFAQSAGTLVGSGKSLAAESANTNSAEIFCREYTLNPEKSFFHGEVRLAHPQMNMTCEEVTVDSDQSGKRARRMTAQPDVVFAMTGDRGKTVHGMADRAIYTYGSEGGRTNELLTLIGKPAVLETTDPEARFRNSTIVFDMQSGLVSARGKYSINGTVPGLETNKLQLPKNKFLK